MLRARLEKLKSLRENVDWGSKDGRVKLLDDLWGLICDWEGKLPNFEEIFEDDEIHALLTECASDSFQYPMRILRYTSIIEFVARSGFRDKPVPGESLGRVTAVHRAGLNEPDGKWKRVISYLFEIYNRFEANYVDGPGMTHFHVACKFGCYEIVRKFLKFGRVDPDLVCGRTGHLPLVLALRHDHVDVYQLLLGKGASPNAADADGLTPLHHLSMRRNADSAERTSQLFRLIRKEYRGRPFDVDAKCEGKTALHLALSLGRMGVAEVLLRNGADPNLTNSEGSTPLHTIAMYQWFHEHNLAEKFFEICSAIRKRVLVDAKDSRDRTALHWAVANILPDTVDEILNRGAVLSALVFPTEAQFVECFDARRTDVAFKLRLACGLVEVVKSLESRGYELSQSDAMTIMKLFSRYELFHRLSSDQSWYLEQVEFASRAKHVLYKSANLSLHDLIQFSTEAMKTIPTYMSYYEGFKLLGDYLPRYEDCVLFVCEKVSRRFFQSHAIEAFIELIRYRLPLECCQMIIEHESNEDLFKICLALPDESSR